MSTGFMAETECNDALTVLRAIEPVVISTFQSLPPMKTDGYHLLGGGTSIGEVTDLEDALAAFPGTAGTIISEYRTDRQRDSDAPFFSIELWVSHNYITKKIYAKVSVFGPNTNETTGLADQLANRVRNEVARQEKSDWTAEPQRLNDEVPPVRNTLVKTPQSRNNDGSAATLVPSAAAISNAVRELGPSNNVQISFWEKPFGKFVRDHIVGTLIFGTIATVAGGVILLHLTKNNDAPTDRGNPPATSVTSSLSPKPSPPPPPTAQPALPPAVSTAGAGAMSKTRLPPF